MGKKLEVGNKKLEVRIFLYSNFCILYSTFFILCIFSVPITSSAQKNKPYHEDLSKWRPKAEYTQPIKTADTLHAKADIKPTKNINSKIDGILDSINQFNALNKFIDGYTIQIYSGQKREDAMNAKKKLQEEIPQLTSTLLYQQPKFRVTVGKYFTKLEAQPDLLKLRKKFSAAILVPEKVSIK